MMLRDRLTLATLVVLFFSLLVAASGGLWLMLQPPSGSEAVSGTLVGLGPDQVLSGLMILSLVNLVLLAGHVMLHWPVLAAGAAALLPNPTVRGLATAVAALGALVVLSLPWLGKASGPALVQTLPEQATPAAAAPASVPIPGPTMAPPARPSPAVAAVRSKPRRSTALRRVPVRHRHLASQRPDGRHPARFRPARRPCLGWYASRRLSAGF